LNNPGFGAPFERKAEALFPDMAAASELLSNSGFPPAPAPSPLQVLKQA